MQIENRSSRQGGGVWLEKLIAAAVVLAAGLLLTPSWAGAISLDMLEGTSSNIGGVLTIQWNKVEQTGGIDLTQIDLQLSEAPGDLGFDLVASGDAFGVTSGGMADLKLEFTVSSTLGIEAVSNYLDAAVSGPNSSASVFETIDEFPAAQVFAFVMEAQSQNPAMDAIVPALTFLTITKNAIVVADTDGGGDGGGLGLTGSFARIDVLEQRFTVVPEPGTAILLGLGLAGLAFGTRERRRDGFIQ